MWNKVDHIVLGDMQVDETLYYYDKPLSFTVKSDKLWYLHLADEEKEFSSYFARECTVDELYQLKNNQITVLDFIQGGEHLYMVRAFNEGEVDMHEIGKNDYPEMLPYEGVYLNL